MRYLHQLIIISTFLFITTSYLHAEIIFQDNFDNRPDWSSSTTTGVAETWPATMKTILGGPSTPDALPAWYSYRAASTSHTTGDPLYVIDSQDPYGGTGKSLRYNLENTSYMNGGGLDLVLCNSGTCGWDEIYISFYIKLEDGFDFENGGGDFIKLIRLYSGVDVVKDNLSPSSTFATTTDQSNGIKRSMNAYLDIVADGNNDYRIKLSYFLGQHNGVDYLEVINIPPASTFNFKNHTGEWIYCQWYVKMNTVGQSNGQMKVWFIPEKSIESYNFYSPLFQWNNLEIRSDSSRKFNTIIMADNMSGTWERPVNEQMITFDNLTISTSPVSPNHTAAISINTITID